MSIDRGRRPGVTLPEHDEASSDPRARALSSRRPWGDFRQLVCNQRVTVKVISIQPGQRLSLQRHEQRSELWRVLDVPIDITVGDRRWTAPPGEEVWVPRGAVHRMGNSASTVGRVLEIAFGHFDETDIERLQDDYAR